MNQTKFNQIVKDFETIPEIYNLLIWQNNTTFQHHFKDNPTKMDVRSISKVVLTIITGMVDGLNENTYIYPIIKDHIHLKNKANLKYLKQIQIKHCLTHTVGFDTVLLMRQDIENVDHKSLLNYVINTPLAHKPGTHYLYSNAGHYLLSATLQHFLKQDLITYMDIHFFKPLNIVDYKWEKYGDYCAGATRLWLYPEDLLKIGQILLNPSTPYLSQAWLNFMKSITTITAQHHNQNKTFIRYAYGHGIWVNNKNLYFGHGTDGQTLIIDPDKNAILITLSKQKDMTKLEEIIDKTLKLL